MACLYDSPDGKQYVKCVFTMRQEVSSRGGSLRASLGSFSYSRAGHLAWTRNLLPSTGLPNCVSSPRRPIAGGGSVKLSVRVDPEVFSIDVVARTAHRYSGEYFVRVDAAGAELHVTLTPRRSEAIPTDLEARFRTDLLDDRLRAHVEAQTGELKALLTRAAFSGAGTEPAS